MSEHSVSLSNEEFENFVRSLSVLKDVCNDVDINDGIIRQRTNDHTTIFQLDLSSLLPVVTMCLSNLKQKLDLLKMFSDEEVEIEISDKIKIKDQYSSIEFEKPEVVIDKIENLEDKIKEGVAELREMLK